MRVSRSAAQRWLAYFPEHELAAVFARARPAGARTKARIQKQCPKRYRPKFSERGVYYLIGARIKAVFVVAPGEYVVDVFPLGEKPERAGLTGDPDPIV